MARDPREADLLRDVRTLFHLGVVRESTDGQLLGQFLGGDDPAAEAAFAILVERHGPMVNACLHKRALDDPDEAQDAFQATFLVLLRGGRGSTCKARPLASWLFGADAAGLSASVRACAAVVRRFHERRGGGLRLWREPHPSGDSAECRAALHEEIVRLPDRYREALVLCHRRVSRPPSRPSGSAVLTGRSSLASLAPAIGCAGN